MSLVIAILVTIGYLSYGNYHKSAITTQLKSDLYGVVSAMEHERNFSNLYPTSTATIFVPSQGVTVTGGSYDSGLTYCVDAVSSRDTSLHFYVLSGGQAAQQGSCPKIWKQVSNGGLYSCAVSYSDKAYCWGYNAQGQLGNDSTSQSKIPMAVTDTGALGGKTVKSVTSTNAFHTCAIASDDQAYCWGRNGKGQLGNGTIVDSSVPVAVDTDGVLNGKTIKSISTASNHTCAIASDNQAYCWGDNQSGQLGNDSTVESHVPVAVDTTDVLAGKTVKSITTGSLFSTCAIASDNQAYCWGDNRGGQLGNGSTVNSDVPVAVSKSGAFFGKTIKSIVAGYSYACAIASDNLAYCWGWNYNGQLGNGTTDSSYVPFAITTTGDLDGKTIKSIAAGDYQACVIASDNQAYCWGSNGYGQLGNNLTTDSWSPDAVDNTGVLSGKKIKSITTSGGHTCVIASDNQAYCWGRNVVGQLGNDSTTESHIPVSTLSPQ